MLLKVTAYIRVNATLSEGLSVHENGEPISTKQRRNYEKKKVKFVFNR